MADSGTYTPETIARRLKIAEQLLGPRSQPIQHWAEGLDEIAKGALGGRMFAKAEADERAGGAAQAQALASLLNSAPAAAASSNPVIPAPAAPPSAPSAAPPMADAPIVPKPVKTVSLTGSDAPIFTPRPEVAPTAKVWGDKEAEAAGLYEKPKGSVASALNAPVQVAQTAPAAALPGAAPDNKAAIAKMLNDPNPYVRKMGQQLATAAVVKQIGQQPKFHKLNDEMLFEEGTGATKPAGPGFKPLVDPRERAAHGIPAEDKRPYQIGPGNKLINPPAETRVNIDQKVEGAFDTKAGQLQAERLDSIVKDGMSAKSMIADMAALKDIGSRITTGKTAEITAALGPYAEALGVKIDSLGDLQAYESIVQKLAPQMRVPGSGATSDFEMRGFLKALPGLGKTPEGNELISNVFNAVQEQKTAAAEIAGKVLHKEISRAEGDKMLRDLPDPLALWKTGRGKLPTSKEVSAPAVRKFNPATGKIE
jgi:hypothetical protein